jgi:hypothetical protein
MRTHHDPLQEEDPSHHGENPSQIKEKLAQHRCPAFSAVSEPADRLWRSIDQHRREKFDSTRNVTPLLETPAAPTTQGPQVDPFSRTVDGS